MSDLPAAGGTGGAGPVLAVRGIVRRFGGVTAVDGVSFGVGAAGVTGLIGPNGAGKTTLFNVITGAYRPSAGHVLFQGRDVTGWGPGRLARAGIARTFQNIRLFARLTVREHLELAWYLHLRRPGWLRGSGPDEVGRQRMGGVLRHLHLVGMEDRVAVTLPYATQRRVEIARALVVEPRLLLLDEPAAGMNPVESRDLREVLAGIAAAGVPMLVVDHDMGLVMNLCSQVVVMNFGRVIATGAPEQVQRDEAVLDAYLGKGWGQHA